MNEDFTYKYSNYRNLGYHLKAFNGFKLGQKALIYTDRITTALDMVNISKECNLKSIALWSMNNKKYPMSEEQKSVRESILTTGIIPDDIDVLIINGSYETGINIKDKNIELVIVNSTDVDTQIQARSRVRKDIKALLLKSNNMIDDIKVVVPEKYLDKNNYYILYCDLGLASLKLSNELKQKGYNTTSLNGGYSEYEKSIKY